MGDEDREPCLVVSNCPFGLTPAISLVDECSRCRIDKPFTGHSKSILLSPAGCWRGAVVFARSSLPPSTAALNPQEIWKSSLKFLCLLSGHMWVREGIFASPGLQCQPAASMPPALNPNVGFILLPAHFFLSIVFPIHVKLIELFIIF